MKTTPRVTDPGTLAELYVGPNQLLALIDNTSAVIYMRNVDGRYMLINRRYEHIFGLRREEIIGLTDHDLFPVEVADSFRANDLQAIAAGKPIEVEETAPGPDGIRTYVTLKFPLFDHADTPYAICGISTDITDRKRAEAAAAALHTELKQQVRERSAELAAATAELEALADAVSEDLQALHGYSQLLLDEDALSETGAAHLHRLRDRADRMTRTIDGHQRHRRESPVAP